MSLPDFQEQWNTGLPVFLKLFNMPKAELLPLLKEICGDRIPDDLFESTTHVYKETCDDEPTKIKVASWDKIDISPFGIHYTKEHGPTTKIVEFNKFFVL